MMQSKKRRGFFITLEGGEGAGKSTLAKAIAKDLELKGFAVLGTREPGGTPLGEKIRSSLLEESTTVIGANAELLLFLASRAQHIEEVILPALEAGKVVICDRFNDSTIAYQGVARGLGYKEVSKLCQLVCRGLKPDLTILLDIDPGLGISRAGGDDRIESEALSFHHHVRSGFHLLMEHDKSRYLLIDASLAAEQVLAEALVSLEERLASVKL